jgi:hypothetical protein
MAYTEVWSSDHARTEIHYFTDEDEYLFGYNPLILPEELLDKLKFWAENYKS